MFSGERYMKILHTADWHLGKNLEGYSRLEEQALFLDDFVKIADEQNVDLVIVAGDVYDHSNPPAQAEQLLYDTLKKLSNNGNRLTLLIAGNHDNAERLVSATPLAKEHGIIMLGTPKTVVPLGKYGNHEIVNSSEGMVEIKIGDEKAVVLAIPYPSEKRLNEVLNVDFFNDENGENARSYNERVHELFRDLEHFYRDDTINLVASHLFTMGVEQSDSERELGGSYIVSSDCFPKNAQYIALGHIHKPQIVPKTDGKARYSGSPIHYNRKEIIYKKQCILVEVSANTEAEITEIPLQVYKPIEVWKCGSVDEAFEMCREKCDENSFVYLEIETDRVITDTEIKEMKKNKKDIISIIPKFNGDELGENLDMQREELSFSELFKGFYKREKGALPSEEVVNFLFSVMNEE